MFHNCTYKNKNEQTKPTTLYLSRKCITEHIFNWHSCFSSESSVVAESENLYVFNRSSVMTKFSVKLLMKRKSFQPQNALQPSEPTVGPSWDRLASLLRGLCDPEPQRLCKVFAASVTSASWSQQKRSGDETQELLLWEKETGV